MQIPILLKPRQQKPRNDKGSQIENSIPMNTESEEIHRNRSRREELDHETQYTPVSMRIFAIESSCDETAAAIVEDGTKVQSSVIATSKDFFERTGGVIPEEAARKQAEC